MASSTGLKLMMVSRIRLRKERTVRVRYLCTKSDGLKEARLIDALTLRPVISMFASEGMIARPAESRELIC